MWDRKVADRAKKESGRQGKYETRKVGGRKASTQESVRQEGIHPGKCQTRLHPPRKVSHREIKVKGGIGLLSS